MISIATNMVKEHQAPPSPDETGCTPCLIKVPYCPSQANTDIDRMREDGNVRGKRYIGGNS